MAVSKKIPLIERDTLLLALRRLNMIVPNDLPILSLYVTTDGTRKRTEEALEFIDAKTKQISKIITDKKIDYQTFQKDINRIKEFIEFSAIDGAKGLAAFVSGYRNIFLTYPINFRFKNEIVFDGDVYKVPLINLLSEQPREVFLFLSPQKAELYRYADGKLEEKEPHILPESKKEPLIEFMRRVKDIYWPYFRSDDVKSVFLLGDKEAMNKFVKVLAKAAIHKIKEKIEVPYTARKKTLEKIAREQIAKYNILVPKKKVEHARLLAQRRMALFGVDPVLKALRDGKVKELLIDPSFTSPGWRCQRCSLMGTSKQKKCPFCQGKIARLATIKKSLKKDALVYNVEITRVSHPYLRAEGDGIAAILRFS